MTTPKLLTIITRKEYFAVCTCCNRKLKHVYETNQGLMGRNCFLRAIGMPVMNANIKKDPELPAEQYESMANLIIDALSNPKSELNQYIDEQKRRLSHCIKEFYHLQDDTWRRIARTDVIERYHFRVRSIFCD